MRVLFLLLFSLTLLFAPAQARANLTLIVGNNPPFNDIQNEKASGMVVSIIEQLMSYAELKYRFVQYPWARALSTAQTETDTCIFSLARLPIREDAFIWIGPLAQNKWTFFALRERNLTIKTLDDARKYSIGGQRKDGKVQFLESNGFTVDLAAEEEQSMKKLYAGHIDLVAGGLFTAKLIAQSIGADPQKIKPLYIFHTADLYLGCSKSTSASHITKLKAALQRMRSDGSLQKITDQYSAEFEQP
ncbi:ABC transporter substrate-binding protein [Chitinibacter sp. SCUT-21]|uniref:substrate-binding periplasmic protein n=1 Tax=Chitinibacter sp. SCUT-21 TaxID=2970891 RepID=UPI0035A5BE18